MRLYQTSSIVRSSTIISSLRCKPEKPDPDQVEGPTRLRSDRFPSLVKTIHPSPSPSTFPSQIDAALPPQVPMPSTNGSFNNICLQAISPVRNHNLAAV